MHCCIEDWAKFLSLQLAGNNPILDSIYLAKLIDPVDYYAGGWGVAEHEWAKGTVLSHNGSNGIWYGTVMVAPRLDRAFVVVTNSRDFSLTEDVCNIMLSKIDVLNPFEADGDIVICSYHFARNKADDLQRIAWDLVVIDEAHRLRNVYKPTNKIANSIKYSIADRPKILLTATPLQNTLLELYGLVSIIDEYSFGDLPSFRSKYTRLIEEGGNYSELKNRLEVICKRTLRRQVYEYVKYTERMAITQHFSPSAEEHRLYIYF